MTTREKQIWEKLKEIPDPELHISLVDLGLIYSVKLTEEKVKITLTLTTIGCPLFGTIGKMIEDKVREIPEVKEVETELVFDPPWSMDMMSEAGKIKLGII